MELSRIAMLALAISAAACSSTRSPETTGPVSSGSNVATDPAITVAELEEHLGAFAHDSMLGRETGTPGNVKATDYLAVELARLGLEPAGDEGTYFQALPLVQWAVDESSGLSVGGHKLELGTDYVPSPRLGRFLPFGMRGSLTGVQVVYGGPASAPASLDAERITGKLVLLGPPVGSDGRPNLQAWSAASLAAFESAAGIAITALDLLPERLLGFITRPRETMNEGPLPGGPLGMFVTPEAADRLLGAPLEEAEPGDPGATIEGSFRFVQRPSPHLARNVVAIVRGSDPAVADEYVAIGSHSDHVGIAGQAADHDSLWAFNRVVRPMGADSRNRDPTAEEAERIDAILDSLRAERPARRDSIYNGADDDGSGSVAMLEIAEAFALADPRPRRSILFVWHTGEERGLWGSNWFTRNPTVPREAIVAQLNLDMIGRGGAADVEDGGPGYIQLIGSRRLSTELGDLVEAVNAESGFGFELDYQYDADGHPQNYYCRSDHYMYARYGIPIVFLSTGSHPDYHQLTDEPQYIDYTKLERVSRFVMAVAERVANLDHRVVVDRPVADPNAPCRQ